MALKGTIDGTTANDRITAKIQWSAKQNIEENSSTITATLTYSRTNSGHTTGGKWSGSLSIGDQTGTLTGNYIEIEENSNTVAISIERTVKHAADGTLSVKISATGKIANSSLTSTTISGTVTLDTIPRASDITSAAAVTLGNACDVRWTPNSSAFGFKLRFYLGKKLIHTTDAIHPNNTSAYTYTDYEIPLTVAEQITDSASGTMTVELITYSDKECKNAIGEANSKEFTVTVPSNADTQPTFDMTLEAVNGLGGLYLQGLSKVQAAFNNVVTKFGAGIKEYKLSTEYQSYSYPGDHAGPCETDPITTTGTMKITGSVTDSRGITGQAEETITVYPYFSPRLSGVKAYRCRSDGTAADDGTYLRIEATREYAPVMVDGAQKNFCQIQFRYKTENAPEYSGLETILATDAKVDSVDAQPPLLTVQLNAENAWSVQIVAKDTVGQSTVVTVAIPSERVFMHKRAGGKGMGLGGMCQEDDLLEVHWNQHIYKNLKVDGNVCGAYIRIAESKLDSNTLTLRTAVEFGETNQVQSILVFGSCWSQIWTVIGKMGLMECSSDNTRGEIMENGTDFVVTLPGIRETPLVLISADPFEIIQ